MFACGFGSLLLYILSDIMITSCSFKIIEWYLEQNLAYLSSYIVDPKYISVKKNFNCFKTVDKHLKRLKINLEPPGNL